MIALAPSCNNYGQALPPLQSHIKASALEGRAPSGRTSQSASIHGEMAPAGQGLARLVLLAGLVGLCFARSWARTVEQGLPPYSGLRNPCLRCQEVDGCCQKVKRICADKKERQMQWQNWESELRQTFAKERHRYVSAIAKLDADLQDAVKGQDEARAALRAVAMPSSPTTGRILERWMLVRTQFYAGPWKHP